MPEKPKKDHAPGARVFAIGATILLLAAAGSIIGVLVYKFIEWAISW